MLDRQVLKELGKFAATGGIKIFLEAPYDELFKTNLGQRLKQLGIASQTGIATAVGLLVFFLQRKLPSESVFKEVAADAWPEFSKRLFNGFTEILVNRSVTASGESKAAIDRLNQLEPEEFNALLESLAQDIESRGPTAWERAVEKIRLSREKLQRIKKRGVLW